MVLTTARISLTATEPATTVPRQPKVHINARGSLEKWADMHLARQRAIEVQNEMKLQKMLEDSEPYPSILDLLGANDEGEAVRVAEVPRSVAERAYQDA